MSVATYHREVEHIGETRGARDHDHDMIDELSRRLDMLWRYDQYIANAEMHPTLQAFWKKVRVQEKENILELKHLIAEHIQNDCF